LSEVTIAVAADITEADEIRLLLAEAGIACVLQPAETALGGPVGDGPCRVLVEATAVEAAIDALRDADDDSGDDGLG